jgi:transcriptional regulator with XRE-family HTH domain
MAHMNTSLSTWLNAETKRRHWSLRFVAAEAGLSHSTVARLANGEMRGTERTCVALATVFNAPIEELLQMAGLPTPINGRPIRDSRRIVYEVNTDEVLLARYRALRPEDQDRVRDLIERLGQIEPRIIGERPEE